MFLSFSHTQAHRTSIPFYTSFTSPIIKLLHFLIPLSTTLHLIPSPTLTHALTPFLVHNLTTSMQHTTHPPPIHTLTSSHFLTSLSNYTLKPIPLLHLLFRTLPPRLSLFTLSPVLVSCLLRPTGHTHTYSTIYQTQPLT